MSQEPAVSLRRRHSSEERDIAIHDDVLDAFGIPMRVVVGRGVGHAQRIEHDEVRPRPDPDLAAVGEPQMPRGERGHLPHRVLERQDPLVARVPSEHARERAIRPWMRFSERQRSVWRVRGRVAPDRDVRLRHDVADVVLVHRVMHDRDITVVLDERVA